MLQWKSQFKFKIKAAILLGLVLVAVFYLFSSFLAAPALAQNQALEGVRVIAQPLGLPTTDIRQIIANIIRVALGLVGLVLTVLIMYGGFLWMTAGGNEEQIGQAKKFLVNAIIGLIIILSAYGLVLFVMRMLGIGLDGPAGGPGGGAPVTQNFTGSGALGRIVKDHYPTRNQINVPRNTKIIVTFRKPVKPASFVAENSGDDILGNCKSNMTSWQNDCDRPIFDRDHIFITRADNNQPITGAAILVNYDEQGKAYSLIFRPYDYLGDSQNKIGYVVRLGSGILLDDPENNDPSAFSTKVLGVNYYEWQFIASTELDLTPPTVSSVFPARNSTESKNSVIQIDFSKPIDPTGIQGEFKIADDGSSYYLTGQNIFATSSASSRPAGAFILTNGYRTLEFVSTSTCGVNACGNPIYCLPVCDKAGANCKKDDYTVLLRAGKVQRVGSFEALPFSGVMDLSGNALDGNSDRKTQNATTTLPVFPTWQEPDNFFWGFKIKDEIDATAPYLTRITPGLDAQYVSAKAPFDLIFSKRMRADSLYGIIVEEKPIQPEPLCLVPRALFDFDGGATVARMDHCPFKDDSRQYYYPIVTSTVEDVHYNCFYPGMGPGGQNEVNAGNNVSSVCDGSPASLNCCAVYSGVDPFCCNGIAGTETTDSCLDITKTNSVL